MDQRVDQHGLPVPQGFDDEQRGERLAMSGSAKRIMRLSLVMVVVVALAAGLWHSPLGNHARQTIAETYFATASDKVQAGMLDEALDDLDTALTWSQDSPEVYFLRAQILQQLGRADESLEAVNRALEISPHFGPAYGVRGLVFQQLKRYPEAIADLEEALRLAPADDATPLNNLAYVRALANDDLPQALEEAERAVELADDPTPAYILDTRGYIYHLLERNEEALVDLDAAVKDSEKLRDETLANPQFKDLPQRQQRYLRQQLDEPLAVMLHHRGLVHEALENAEQAEADLQRARELGYDPEAGVF